MLSEPGQGWSSQFLSHAEHFFTVIFLESVRDLHCFLFHWLLELEKTYGII